MMKLLLTTALVLSAPAVASDLPARLPMGSPVVAAYEVPVAPAPTFKPLYAFETVGFAPVPKNGVDLSPEHYLALRDAFNSPATTDAERSYMTGCTGRQSVAGVTDWAAARQEYLLARAAALESHRPLGEGPKFKHQNKFWHAVGTVVLVAASVAVGAAIDTAENTYHTSSSYTDSRGHTVTVKCSTYIGSNNVDTSCR